MLPKVNKFSRSSHRAVKEIPHLYCENTAGIFDTLITNNNYNLTYLKPRNWGEKLACFFGESIFYPVYVLIILEKDSSYILQL